MKKLFVLLPALIFCNLFSNAQIAYYDAKMLYDNYINLTSSPTVFKSDPQSLNEIAMIIHKYSQNPLVAISLHDFVDGIKTNVRGNKAYNPFLAPFFEVTIQEGSVDITSSKSGFKSIGGLDVTNIANGIAQFMIKRAKEELTIAFFNRFKKFADENPEFQVLFPKTTDNLENLLAFKYPDMLPALRTGFFEDIKSTPYHLDDVLELPRYQELLKDLPEVKVVIKSLRLLNKLESGDSHAADILTKFSEFKEWSETSPSNQFKNFGSSIKLAEIFSNSLRNDPSRSHSVRAWITSKQLDTLVSNDTIFTLYLGLIYEKVISNQIWFYVGVPKAKTLVIGFDSIMAAQKDNLFLFKNKVSEFIELANKVDKVLDTIKNRSTPSVVVTYDHYYDYIDVSLDVIDYGISIGKLFDERLDIDKYAAIARKANDLYRNIYKQEYTLAISNVVDLLQNTKALINEYDYKPTEENIKIMNSLKLGVSLSSKKDGETLSKKDIIKIDHFIDTSSINPVTLKNLRRVKSLYYLNRFDGKLLKITQYGLFMANMANADSPEEVSSILDNVTLPVGSSSIKKNSSFNMAIQSYLGGYGRIGSLNFDNNSTWSSPIGITAPIGVALSLGLPKKLGSVSLFASLLDIGAIVDYQLTADFVPSPSGGDSVVISKDYKVKLGQIFSPGAFLVYGLPWNIPLSIGIGGQYGPGLGKIETTGNSIVNNPQWRANIFLAVDIPFFNLVNVPKKYKPD